MADDDVFSIEINNKLEVLLFIIEAYKADVITKQELLQALVDICFQI